MSIADDRPAKHTEGVMDRELRLLMVEDQPLDAELLQRELKRGGMQFSARRVDTQESFKQALSEFRPDLILSDFSMPTFDGMSALTLAQEHCPEVPFIFVSGTIGEERAVEALKRGATDYVLKDRPKRLVAAISRALDDARKRATLRRSQEALQTSEERFRSFMRHLPARASIRDKEGRYTYVNHEWQRTWDLKAEEVLGKRLDEIIPGERAKTLWSFHHKVLETNKAGSRIFKIESEGQSQWWCSNYFPIPDSDGNVGVGTIAVNITDQKTQEEKLSYLADHDALTGLPNRKLLHERLDRCLKATGEKAKTALIIANIDRFGIINESLGHHAGDILLCEIAGRLSGAWPDRDKIGRIAENSFGGMLADVGNEAEVRRLLERVTEQVFSVPFIIDGNEISVSMTAGIAVGPSDGKDADALLRNGEAALKRAKESNSRFAFYERKMNATVIETLALENKLRRALEHDRFELYYQPKVDLLTGKIVGLEALMRWNDPELGLVSPVRFIPLLEQTGLIIPVGQWALSRALADRRTWQNNGVMAPRVAVNVSAIQLAQDDFSDMVQTMVAEYEGGSHGLDLEITESVLMRDIEANSRKLLALRKREMPVAIDDFGTGYSSLSYLAKLPITSLKVDRSFVIAMTDDADCMAIAATIISLAHSLNRKVIAEGVETDEQHQLLKLLKCDEAQGYLFSKPLNMQGMTDLLKSTGGQLRAREDTCG